MAKNWKDWLKLLYQDQAERNLSSKEVLEVFRLAITMDKEDVELDLVVKSALAAINRNKLKVFLLMRIWKEQESKKDRTEVLSEIQKELSEVRDAKSIFIPFIDLDLQEKHILEFKDALRSEIDKQGGIREVCNRNPRVKLNESSLSRFLRYNAKPKAPYMDKLNQALGKEGLEVKVN